MKFDENISGLFIKYFVLVLKNIFLIVSALKKFQNRDLAINDFLNK